MATQQEKLISGLTANGATIDHTTSIKFIKMIDENGRTYYIGKGGSLRTGQISSLIRELRQPLHLQTMRNSK